MTMRRLIEKFIIKSRRKIRIMIKKDLWLSQRFIIKSRRKIRIMIKKGLWLSQRFIIKSRRKIRIMIKRGPWLSYIIWFLTGVYMFIFFGGVLWVIILENFF